MSAEILPFDFEEQAVRIVLRDGEPWFVAADVCRVLEIGNTTNAVKRLDEDEVTLYQIKGSHRETNLISESGLYALVIRSDKPAARRFRKWITSEVLPAIRRHGRYEHPGIPANDAAGDMAGLTFREAELWLQAVREARLSKGARAAVSIWARSPLPPLVPGADAAADPAEARACLRHLMADLAGAIAAARDGCSDVGADHLTANGCRVLDHGLFIANFALRVFEGSRWAGGKHRAALLGLAGVAPDSTGRSMGGVCSRGLVVPWALIEGGRADG